MVVSDATRAQTRRDNALAAGTSAPPMVEEACESSRASPWAGRAPPQEREAYVTVDALKGIMSTMVDTIRRQVTEQVRRAPEVAGTDEHPIPLEHPIVRAGFSR